MRPAEPRPDADDILVVCANCRGRHVEGFHHEPDAHGDGTWCLALDCDCEEWSPVEAS